MIAPIVGDSSFMLKDGDEHLKGRRAVLPALHAKAVERQADGIIETVERACRSWPVDKTLALYPLLLSLTLEIILHKVFVVGQDVPDDWLSGLRDKLLTMLSITATTALSVPLRSVDPRRATWRRFMRRRKEVDDLIFALIEKRARTQNEPESPRFAESRDNILSIILAGHETTASQLAWIFQLLAHNPRVLQTLIEEIDSDAGDRYLTATIQEALRHRPVFLFAIPRAVVKPIRIGGWDYEPPTRLLACIYLMQHDPALYPDPQSFQPERFLDAPPRPGMWVPWGGGRKRCPGSHLAMFELKSVVRTVLSTRTIHPVSKRLERPRWRSVVITPHAGCRVSLTARRPSGPRRESACSPEDGHSDRRQYEKL